MSEFSFTTASAMDLLEWLDATTVPPLADPQSLSTEYDRLALMEQAGRRGLVDDLLIMARGHPDGD